MRMSDGSLGSILRITSPAGAIPCSSCLATAAKDFSPPSCQAISPQGVFRSGFAFATTPVDDVELGPDEDGDVGLGDGLHLGPREDRIDPSPGAGLAPASGQMDRGP